MLWWTLFRLRSGSEKARQAAIRRFTAAPDPRAFDALVRLVEHGAGEGPYAAACALAALGEERAAEPLARLLRSAEHSLHYFANIARALGALEKLGHPATKALIAAMQTTRVERKCDGELRHMEFSERESHLRDREAEDYRREQAAWALGRLKNSEAIPALIDAMGDRVVANRAKQALVDLGPLAIPALLQVLVRESGERAGHAIAALGKIGGEDAIDALVRVLETGTTSLRRTAAIAVENLRDPRVVRALIATLRDPDQLVRQFTAKLLGEWRERSPAEAIFDGLILTVEKYRELCQQVPMIEAGDYLVALHQTTGMSVEYFETVAHGKTDRRPYRIAAQVALRLYECPSGRQWIPGNAFAQAGWRRCLADPACPASLRKKIETLPTSPGPVPA